MGGRSSRNKGRRVEYAVRDYFRELGYTSNRVPLSGASQYAKGDITLEKNGLKLITEVKVRHNEFASIYALYDTLRAPCTISYNGDCVVVSKSFTDLGFESNLELPSVNLTDSREHSRTVKKLFNLKKLVKDCHFLTIKIDYKPFIFLRYIP